jgi:hypothetical protein
MLSVDMLNVVAPNRLPGFKKLFWMFPDFGHIVFSFDEKIQTCKIDQVYDGMYKFV